MSDPLSDPRAHDLLAADPGVVSSIASALTRISGEAGQVAGALRSADSAPHWTGSAAEAFRSKVGKLPGELDKVTHSYSEAGGALNGYEPALADQQSRLRSLSQQLQSARQSAGAVSGQLAGAKSSLHTAQSAKGATGSTPAVQSAQSAVSQASGALSRAQGEIDSLTAQAYRVLDEFDASRSHCASRISSACSLAPHQSWLDSMLSDVGNFMVGVFSGIYHGVVGLPGAIVDFAEHPSWESFDKVLEDVAITASVVSVVLTLGADAPLLAGVAGGMDAASGVLDTTAASASAAKAGNDLLHGHPGDAAAALVAAALPSASNALGVGETAAASAEANSSLIGSYDDALLSGASPSEALAGFSASERQSIVDQVATPTSASTYTLGDASAAVTASSAAAARAAKMARMVGTPLDYGVENTIEDPGKKALAGAVNRAAGVPACG